MCPRWVLKMQVTAWQELCACVFWCQPCTGHHHLPPPPVLSEWSLPTGWVSCPPQILSNTHTHTHIYKYPVQMGLFEQFRHTQAHHDVTPPLRLCSCDRQPHSACLCVCTHTEFSSISMNINHEAALNVYFSLAVLKVLCVCAWKEIWKWGKGNRIITFR